MTQFYHYFDSPLGNVLISSNKLALTGLYFVDQKHMPKINEWQSDESLPILHKAAEQFLQYFNGTRQEFNLPIQFVTGTAFQQKVWHALAKIPFGETISYGKLAEKINAPQSVRAVASAVGRNPLTVIIPCHRVIGSNGKLTGYAGGLDRKQVMLALEKSSVSK